MLFSRFRLWLIALALLVLFNPFRALGLYLSMTAPDGNTYNSPALEKRDDDRYYQYLGGTWAWPAVRYDGMKWYISNWSNVGGNSAWSMKHAEHNMYLADGWMDNPDGPLGSYLCNAYSGDLEGLTVTVHAGSPGNDPPTCTLDIIVDGLTVQATVSGSDTDGTIDTYKITWGDGSSAFYGSSASHTYTEPGDYTVTGEVWDDDNASATDTKTASIANGDPVVSMSYTISGDPPVLQLDLSGSSDDTGIASFTIDWGDGSPVETTGYTNISHQYDNSGWTNPVTMPVTVTATDDYGASSSQSYSIEIADGSSGGDDPIDPPPSGGGDGGPYHVIIDSPIPLQVNVMNWDAVLSAINNTTSEISSQTSSITSKLDENRTELLASLDELKTAIEGDGSSPNDPTLDEPIDNGDSDFDWSQDFTQPNTNLSSLDGLDSETIPSNVGKTNYAPTFQIAGTDQSMTVDMAALDQAKFGNIITLFRTLLAVLVHFLVGWKAGELVRWGVA